jgi:hypothetical protein
MNIILYLRQFRIGPFAIFDFASSLIVVALLSPLLSWLFLKMGIKIPLRSWILWTVPVAELIHIIIGQQTALTKMLLDPRGHYIAKVVVLVLLVVGFWGIKIAKR